MSTHSSKELVFYNLHRHILDIRYVYYQSNGSNHRKIAKSKAKKIANAKLNYRWSKYGYFHRREIQKTAFLLTSEPRTSFFWLNQKNLIGNYKFSTCLLRIGQRIDLFGKFLIYFLTIKAFLNKNDQYLIYHQANFTKNRRNNVL